MLDLTFPKMVIGKYREDYDDRSEWLHNLYVSPADRSGRR